MADLNYQPFAANARIKRAANNAPAMKRGEQDRAAVVILQEALIKAGFAIKDGATGVFGAETAAAVHAVETAHQLNVDTGDAGTQVIHQLDALLTGRHAKFFIRSADLQLFFQQTSTQGGFTHDSYVTKARNLLEAFGLTLNITNLRTPELSFAELVDPSNRSDIERVRVAAEKSTPGMIGTLRVIFCRFSSGNPFNALTDGGPRPLPSGLQVPDFTLIDVGKRRADQCVLIHEMIHATGLEQHDSDMESVFSEGSNRSVLKPEHAERLSNAFFARRR